jgi:hypothetical protein
MKGTLIVEKGGYQDNSTEENFSVFHATFPFVRGRYNTLSNRIVLHDSAYFGLHYSAFLVQQLKRELGKDEDPSHIPMLRATSSI